MCSASEPNTQSSAASLATALSDAEELDILTMAHKADGESERHRASTELHVRQSLKRRARRIAPMSYCASNQPCMLGKGTSRTLPTVTCTAPPVESRLTLPIQFRTGMRRGITIAPDMCGGRVELETPSEYALPCGEELTASTCAC